MISLNHTIVPARDKVAAAKFFARIFGLRRGRTNHFAPVRVNKGLTLLVRRRRQVREPPLRFHVSEREFDAIFRRVKKAGLAYGSAPGASPTASSTTGAAAAASTSRIRTATCWS